MFKGHIQRQPNLKGFEVECDALSIRIYASQVHSLGKKSMRPHNGTPLTI